MAIVRFSGPDAPAIARRLSRRAELLWQSHRLYLCSIHGQDEAVIDQGLVVWMKAPHSYTGEEVVEAHLHGGSALCGLVVQAGLAWGARLARPGEFTQRAFLNGKLDLAQAEAVQQLIQSRSGVAARLASRNLQGLFSQSTEEIRGELLHWLAMLEAEIDFGDEVSGLPAEESRARLSRARSRLKRMLEQGQAGKALTDGLRTVIYGAPNAGKSTLLNTLLGRQRALVTPLAGTTRDTLEETLSVDGVPLLLVDTAGVRPDAVDLVEQLGMERSRSEAGQADLVLWIADASAAEPPPEPPGDTPRLLVLNKSDLPAGPWCAGLEGVRVSLLSGQGLEALWQALAAAARRHAPEESTRLTARQWEALLRARESLDRVAETLEAGLSAEFLALDLRAACEALGEIAGLNVTEEVLDRIFSTFCLGK